MEICRVCNKVGDHIFPCERAGCPVAAPLSEECMGLMRELDYEIRTQANNYAHKLLPIMDKLNAKLHFKEKT